MSETFQEHFDRVEADVLAMIRRRDAEIERMKLELHNEKQYAADLITTLRCEAEDLKALIAELCDALEAYCWDESGLNHDPDGVDLITRAREATK